MGKIIYTDERAVDKDIDLLNKAQKSAQTIFDYLKSKVNDLSFEDILNAIHGNFSRIVSNFKSDESEKVLSIIQQFGESALTDGWEAKVEEKMKVFKNELLHDMPVFAIDVIDFFSFLELSDNSGVIIKKQFNKSYFVDKHSIKLESKEDVDFYEKHLRACELLNDIMKYPDNEFERLDKLFFFNAETKDFEINIEEYINN
jgi:hypothetical protein